MSNFTLALMRLKKMDSEKLVWAMVQDDQQKKN